MKELRPISPRTLTIMPTYKCTANCKNCGAISSPRDRNRLDWEDIQKTIADARTLGFSNVVFSGGEPTLELENLLAGISLASSLGFPTRIVSNAHWAFNMREARNFIGLLKNAGLNEINFSTGDEHARFVPVENIVFAIIASLEQNLSLAIMIETRAERSVTKSTIENHPTILGLTEDQRTKIRINESPWMPLDPFEVEEYSPGAAVNSENLTKFAGCESVLSTYVLQADGRIAACCGLGMRTVPELNVGNVKNVDSLRTSIVDAEDDLIKLWLRYYGPEKILEWVSEKNPSLDWQNKYAHKCQACMRIFKDPEIVKVIHQNADEIIGDLIFRSWLAEELLPKINS